MSRSTYILQKDLPNVRAGEMFFFDEKNIRYVSNSGVHGCFFHPSEVQNNPEWFLPEDKRTVVSDFEILAGSVDSMGACWYKFKSSKYISPPEYESTMRAIEMAAEFCRGNFNSVLSLTYNFKYTEEDMKQLIAFVRNAMVLNAGQVLNDSRGYILEQFLKEKRGKCR